MRHKSRQPVSPGEQITLVAAELDKSLPPLAADPLGTITQAALLDRDGRVLATAPVAAMTLSSGGEATFKFTVRVGI